MPAAFCLSESLRMETILETRVAPADADGIEEAAQLLRRGELVAFPTETVYGLGANALDDRAVSAVFAAKKRPRFNPLIIHVPDWEYAAELVRPNQVSESLARQFWPGGLTLVLPRRQDSRISLLATAGLDSIAVRAPAHRAAQELLRRTGLPIAAPSANRAGRISPTTAQACTAELNGVVQLVLDGGPCMVGIESTVIGFDGDTPVLLRSGAIAREDIENITGPLSAPNRDSITAPGMLRSHYAPRAKLRLNAHHAGSDEALLAFGPPCSSTRWVCNLSAAGDLREAAANLFAMLRHLDDTGAKSIAVMPIPNTGLGEAINDRLTRAAAPRETT